MDNKNNLNKIDTHFNYYKFQYYFFNAKLMKSQILNCIFIETANLFPNLIIFIYGALNNDIFSIIYLVFSLLIMKNNKTKIIKILFFIVLII